MPHPYDVIIVGGGAIGAACAREAARLGRHVLVLERAPRGGRGEAWTAAAGILAPHIEASGNPALFPLGLAALYRHASLAAELNESGLDPGLDLSGVVHLALSETESESLERDRTWQAARGHPAVRLSTQEVRARWPILRDAHGALWADGDGVIDARRLVAALLADAQRRGAVVVQDTVTEVNRADDRIVGVTGKHDAYRSEQVILAAGAWSGAIRGLARPVAVEPVRGQMIALPCPQPAPPSVVFGAGGYLVVRRTEVIAGSTMEHAGYDLRATREGLAGIYRRATRLWPPLAQHDITKYWTGLRPVTPDGLPILGPDPDIEGLWHATGHGRNGILMSPITGVIMARFLGGAGPAGLDIPDLSPFSPARFWRW